MKIRIENVAEPGEAPVSVLVRDQGTPLSTQYDLQVGESRDLTLYEGAELYLVSWRAQSFIEIDPSSGQPTEKKDVYPETIPNSALGRSESTRVFDGVGFGGP